MKVGDYPRIKEELKIVHVKERNDIFMNDYEDCVFIIFNDNALMIQMSFLQAQFKINSLGNRVIHGKVNV